jgi:MerR family transcriptional regulator, thiopeptide resistance regulator
MSLSFNVKEVPVETAALQVGDLAKQTGVSVRTLHYYDEIGLLCPSQRTEAGYRLYAKADILRLQQIVSLRQIGFSLDDIRDCLARGQQSFADIVQLHINRIRQQMELSQKLLERLEAIQTTITLRENVAIDDLLQIIQVMNMLEKYYSPEQLETLQQRQQLLGEERIQQSQIDWQDLIAQFQTEMQKGTDPSDVTVQALVRRRQTLIDEFTGGDPAIAAALNQMYEQEGAAVASANAIDAALAEYVSLALQHADAQE